MRSPTVQSSKWILILALVFTPMIFGATPSELFQIAKEFYARELDSEPWPETKPTGSSALKEAAMAGEPEALYSLYVGFQFGFLGHADPVAAKAYYEKWVAMTGNPSALYEGALLQLDALKWVPEPKPGATNFIFTGDFSRRNRQKVLNEPKWLTGKPATRNDAAATRLLCAAVENALKKGEEITKDDQAAAEKSLDLLGRSSAGLLLEIRDSAGHLAQPIPPIVVTTEKQRVLKVLIQARGRGMQMPASAFEGLVNLVKTMNEDDMRSALVESPQSR